MLGKNFAVVLIDLFNLMRAVQRGNHEAMNFLSNMRRHVNKEQLLSDVLLANAFDKLSPGTKFRAMVENWSYDEIVDAVHFSPVWFQTVKAA